MKKWIDNNTSPANNVISVKIESHNWFPNILSFYSYESFHHKHILMTILCKNSYFFHLYRMQLFDEMFVGHSCKFKRVLKLKICLWTKLISSFKAPMPSSIMSLILLFFTHWSKQGSICWLKFYFHQSRQMWSLFKANSLAEIRPVCHILHVACISSVLCLLSLTNI